MSGHAGLVPNDHIDSVASTGRAGLASNDYDHSNLIASAGRGCDHSNSTASTVSDHVGLASNDHNKSIDSTGCVGLHHSHSQPYLTF